MAGKAKEINIVILDVGRQMKEEELAIGKKFLSEFLRERIFDPDMYAGVVLIGARGAKSFFSKEGGGDFEGYGNIRMLENVRKISSRLLESVSNLNLEQGNSNYVDGMVVGLDLLHSFLDGFNSKVKPKAIRLILVSNGRAAEEEEELSELCAVMRHRSVAFSAYIVKEQEGLVSHPLLQTLMEESDAKLFLLPRDARALHPEPRNTQVATFNSTWRLTANLSLKVCH
ncbi:hypothetical protein GUITHDRAFT_110686 [Guillardia theta CCMP2712]|uniref:VWFA domain-containing protein n=1 Tax=Guillardia theta (strain CCMP2712) TaxID=905079 RepID=L1J457_GUITC|nr:hypothetical protein GUITHDRAFT_110686 [Guillardia theta CCMP2712]EKX43271.1 hypothetical protein GUITHDRAFT_110686 [Guillardia theta CCMP2712]|eukprot:XP_005830251.1 hypothetical protein GUITHDRAFT_110686 [Guillardia theta CCMP2712]